MDHGNSIGCFNEEKTKPVKSSRKEGWPIRKMWLAAFTALFQGFAVGLASGYSAPATYDMKTRANSVIKPTGKEEMWIGSIVALGAIVGGIIAGPLADKIGRKDILVYNIVPHGFGWLIICYAQTVPVLLLGRFVCGVACGVIAPVLPVYCVEIATNDVRGILGSALQGFAGTGFLFSVSLGAYISWKYLALNATVFAIFSVIFFCPMPETPRWLLMKNQFDKAVRVMNELHGRLINAKRECEIIYEDMKNQPKGCVTWNELKHPTSFRPAIIIIFIIFFKQFSGIYSVLLYSTEIFEVSSSFMNPKIVTIILGAVQVVTTLSSNFIVDRSGRKVLLIISGSLMSISYTIFGVYYYKLAFDPTIVYKYSWIPIVSCVSAVVGFSIGYGPLPFLLSAEMLPTRTRSTICAFVHALDGLFVFFVTNTFSDFERFLKNYGTFWFYSSVSAIGVIFVIFFVPETKGKKLEEIQNIFYKKETTQNIDIKSIS